MSTKLQAAELYIRIELSTGPKPFSDLRRGTTISERSLQAAGKLIGVRRTRAGESGAWIWSLPPAPAAEPSPEPEVIEGELVAVDAVTAPPLILPQSLSGPADIDFLINAAVELGLKFPLSITRRSPSGQHHITIYTDVQTAEVFLNNFTPDGSDTRVSIKHWDATLQRPCPPALIWDHGNLVWQESKVPPAGFWRGDPNFRRRRSNT